MVGIKFLDINKCHLVRSSRYPSPVEVLKAHVEFHMAEGNRGAEDEFRFAVEVLTAAGVV